MDKAELRRAMIARRDALDLDVRAAKSAAICARLVELLDRSDAAAPRIVAVYAAMGSEVDPAAFAAAADKRGWRVAYPCMFSATDAAACGQRMCMRAVAADDASSAPFIATPRGPSRPWTSTATASLSCLPRPSTWPSCHS